MNKKYIAILIIVVIFLLSVVFYRISFKKINVSDSDKFECSQPCHLDLENLDVKCFKYEKENPPMCTLEEGPGDICLQYVSCDKTNYCQTKKDETKFNNCVKCVKDCLVTSNDYSFECSRKCDKFSSTAINCTTSKDCPVGGSSCVNGLCKTSSW